MNSLVILGIDPGSRVTGFGVLKLDGDAVTHVSHGIISLADEPRFANRLLDLGETLKVLIQKHKPQVISIEKLFLAKNPHSAFQLGHARGVILAEAARSGAEIFEYAPRVAKKSLTGAGASTKEEISLSLCRLLRVKKISHLDASDALALAWHQSQVLLESQRIKRASLVL